MNITIPKKTIIFLILRKRGNNYPNKWEANENKLINDQNKIKPLLVESSPFEGESSTNINLGNLNFMLLKSY